MIWERHEQEDPMVTLCRFANELRYEDIPEEVLEFSKQLILDTIGCMVGGHNTSPIPEITDLYKDIGGKEESYVPFFGWKMPAENAAMCMGPMTRAIDFAPIHADAMHSSEHTIPALLAAVGLLDKVNGKDFLTAFIAGQEVLLRIGIAFNGNKGIVQGRSNGHYIFGSVVAVAKLLELDLETMLNAVGIARNMTQPHDMASYHPVTHMIKVHQGFIAQDAITCNKMARIGVTGPKTDILFSERGFLNMAAWETKPDELLKELGEKWHTMGIEMKAYAGCKCLHMAGLGAQIIVDDNKLGIDDIEHIHVEECLLNAEVSGGPIEEKLNPQDTYQCQFSVPFIIATMLYDGDIMPVSFKGDAIFRENIREFMKKVSLEKDESLPEWYSKVILTTKDGRRFEKTTGPEELKGSIQNRYSEEELIEKFKKLITYSILQQDESEWDKLIENTLRLEEQKDVVDDIVKYLIP